MRLYCISLYPCWSYSNSQLHLRCCNASLGGPFVAGEEARGGCKFNSEVWKQHATVGMQQVYSNSVLECTRWTCEFGPEDKQTTETDLLPEAGARLRAASKKVRVRHALQGACLCVELNDMRTITVLNRARVYGFGVAAVWLRLRLDSLEVCTAGAAAVLPGVSHPAGAHRAWPRRQDSTARAAGCHF